MVYYYSGLKQLNYFNSASKAPGTVERGQKNECM